jgi:hypothetical protein
MTLPFQAALVLAYVVPIALAAWWISRLAGQRARAIVLALLALPLFYLLHFHLVDALQGWPAKSQLPAGFRLLSHVIHEPDDSNGTSGYILLWAMPDGAARPRAFELAYDKALHAELEAAAKRQANGRPQRGERVEPTSSQNSSSSHRPASPGIRLFDGPAIRPPPKPLR